MPRNLKPWSSSCTCAWLLASIISASAQVSPPESPVIFMENIVSTNLNERDMAISPDGNEMFFTIQSNQHAVSTIIRLKKLSNNKWSNPEVASFSGKYSDLEPAFSPDGRKLYFSSNRPVAGDDPKDYDIWFVEKINEMWTTPKSLGAPINTSANEFYPSIASNGNIYFTAEYDNGVGKEDIYLSRWVNGAFSTPAPLDTAVNSKLWEFNAFVTADERYIIFTSYGRKNEKGGGDLYISAKNSEGKWTPAKVLNMVNSNVLDYCPFVTADQKSFFFTSGRHNLAAHEKTKTFSDLTRTYNDINNGSENIYWMSFDSLLQSIK
jgi:Tol biopolymer transport system component